MIGLMLFSGCSSSATFKLRDGRQTSGRIVRSDTNYVLIEKDGASWLVKRDDIADVSHPGTGELIASAVLFGLVGLVAIEDFSTPDDCGGPDTYYCTPQGAATLGAGIFFGIPGLILGIDGVATHYGSRSRYSSTSGGHPIQFQTTPATPPASRPPLNRWCGTPREKQDCEAGGGVCLTLGSTFVCTLPGAAAPTTPAPPPESAPSIEPEPAPTDEPEPAPTDEPESAPTDESEPPQPTEPPSGSTAPARSSWCQLRGCP